MSYEIGLLRYTEKNHHESLRSTVTLTKHHSDVSHFFRADLFTVKDDYD